MLKINAKPTFWNRVTIALPGAEPEDFDAKFNVLSVTVTQELDLKTAEGSANFLRAVVADVSSVEGADGKPAAFSPGLLETLIDNPLIRGALARSYFAGLAEAARGN